MLKITEMILNNVGATQRSLDVTQLNVSFVTT